MHQLPDYQPLAVANQTFEQWFNKPLQDCILDDDDRECNMRTGDKVENQLAYFCGQDYECSLHGSAKVLSAAKRNVEKYFAVVGVLERLDETLFVLEKKLGVFMKGVSRLYRGQKANKAWRREEISREAADKMKSILSLEYEFFDFVNARLTKQLKELALQ